MQVRELVDDTARVAALHRLGILDVPAAPDLDAITRLAAYVAGAPFAAINLIDAERQWQAAVTGGRRGQVPRSDSMCDVTVTQDSIVHVTDARADRRFDDNPFVTGVRDHVRMYCGVPLHDQGGYAVGSLCVTDSVARPLDERQLAALADLALQVEQLFELRRQHTELVDVLAEVDHYATFDALTGLVNRRTLVGRLEHALARGQRTHVMPTVFFCDLDGFKAINDQYGHDAGDDVIVTAGRRLDAVIRSGDTVSRWGGDEFVVVCEDLDPRQRSAVLTRMRGTVAEPVRLADGTTVRFGISIGTVQADELHTAADVLREADRRMYLDKQNRQWR